MIVEGGREQEERERERERERGGGGREGRERGGKREGEGREREREEGGREGGRGTKEEWHTNQKWEEPAKTVFECMRPSNKLKSRHIYPIDKKLSHTGHQPTSQPISTRLAGQVYTLVAL